MDAGSLVIVGMMLSLERLCVRKDKATKEVDVDTRNVLHAGRGVISNGV